jgi:hypothetical protein
MPISLDEAEGIRCQLQALEWANKNRSVLMSINAPSNITAVSSEEDPDYKHKNARFPRFSEIQSMKNELSR